MRISDWSSDVCSSDLLNREWHAPTLERSPEVLHVLKRMDETGVDFAMDVHGDESIPHVFLAGFDGIPQWTDAPGVRYRRFVETLERLTPDSRLGTAIRHPRPARPICRSATTSPPTLSDALP